MTQILSIDHARKLLAQLHDELTQNAHPEVAIITDNGEPVLAILSKWPCCNRDYKIWLKDARNLGKL